MMQFTKTFFFDSAFFIEKQRVKNQLWRKSEFLRRKQNIIKIIISCVNLIDISVDGRQQQQEQSAGTIGVKMLSP
jgi:hypothetical protein